MTSRTNDDVARLTTRKPCVLRLVKLSLKWGGSAYELRPVKKSSKECPVLGCCHIRMDRKSELVPIGKSTQSSHPRTSALTQRPQIQPRDYANHVHVYSLDAAFGASHDANHTGKALLTQYTFAVNGRPAAVRKRVKRMCSRTVQAQRDLSHNIGYSQLF